ncbi:MAG TPA: zinc ribbon domain-containing protein [Candidatus Acidoferrum sp.]|nr:zinc ribbon domain-containing protein [Candidatus Acidoferrum sp.]
MYCDRCGMQLTAGAQFCSKCGKAIVGGGAATPPAAGRGMGQAAGPAGAYGVAAGADGRVQRHLRTVATLWTINGILRLAGVCWMMLFGSMVFPFLRGWGRGVVWPFGGRWGWDIPFLGGLFSVGIFLGLFGVLHLVLAWGLFEREPWARMLGLALGFLALLRFPLGTALGIYTLWVLLPESSGAEYDRLARGSEKLNSAAVSS